MTWPRQLADRPAFSFCWSHDGGMVVSDKSWGYPFIAGWFISWKIVLPCHHFRNLPYFAKTVSTCCKGMEWSSQCAMWRLLIIFGVAIDIPTIIFRNSLSYILGHLIPFIVISPKISTIKKDEFHSHIVPHSYMAKSMEISIINVN